MLLTLTRTGRNESPDRMIKIVRTLVANRRDVNDSFKWAARGDKLRIIYKTHQKDIQITAHIDMSTHKRFRVTTE